MSEEKQAGGLAAKMARVMMRTSAIPKSGRNDFHRYDYATETDIVQEIRGAMAEEGIAIFPSVVEHSVEGSGKQQVSTVTLEITLVCADSGQERTVRWVGQGADSGDKGYYKAYTGAMKYFLLKTFLLPTGDDPERDTRQQGQDRKSSRGRAPQRRQDGQRRSSSARKQPKASPARQLAQQIYTTLSKATDEGQARQACLTVADQYMADSLTKLKVEELEAIQQEIKTEGAARFVARTLAPPEGQPQSAAPSPSTGPPSRDDLASKDAMLKDEQGQGRPALPQDSGDVPGIEVRR